MRDMTSDVGEVPLGARVVVRHRLPRPDEHGHTVSDVVGHLVARDAEHVVVDTRHGTVTVPRPAIEIVKPVPPRPSRRGAPHRALSVDALQEVMAQAWGALERAWLGRWQLRAGGGYTMRANSVALLGDPGIPFPEAVERCRRWYAARGLPLNVTVGGPVGFLVEDDPVGALLLAAGAHVSERCLTMTADVREALTTLADAPPAAARVRISEDLSDAWLAAHRGYRTTVDLPSAPAPHLPSAPDLALSPDLSGKLRDFAEFREEFLDQGPESPRSGGVSERGGREWAKTARAVLTGSPGQLFAMVTAPNRRDGAGGSADDGTRTGGGDTGDGDARVIALGRAGLTPGWVGLGSIWVDPAHRHRGLARAVSRALLEEALDRGHRWAHLQVLCGNMPARELYTTMGFRPHHEYVNVIDPTLTPPTLSEPTTDSRDQEAQRE